MRSLWSSFTFSRLEHCQCAAFGLGRHRCINMVGRSQQQRVRRHAQPARGQVIRRWVTHDSVTDRFRNLSVVLIVMAALCNRAGQIYFHAVVSSTFFFFSSPNLSGRRLDVYHTSTHGVALKPNSITLSGSNQLRASSELAPNQLA